MSVHEEYVAAARLREGLRGGFDPAPRSLSDGIMPDSAACNARRAALKAVIESVGLERTIIIARSVAASEGLT
jgi:hypothetical protein